MVLYMTDYMADLMTKGLSEDEAFAKAKDELAATEETDSRAELQARIWSIIDNATPADCKMAGLFYSGFALLGLAVGAVAGFWFSGGRMEFLYGGWIDTIVGLVAGLLIGTGVAQLCNAVVIAAMRRND